MKQAQKRKAYRRKIYKKRIKKKKDGRSRKFKILYGIACTLIFILMFLIVCLIDQAIHKEDTGSYGWPTVTINKYEPPVEIPVDFEALKEKNPEIYAWITVPGTTIDYPIAQSKTDDSYYLYYDVAGEKTTAASIFTEKYNKKDFSDPFTVVYGHNMRNGTMFGALHKYEDREFFDENRDIYIYLPDKILHYRIFAAYVTDNKHLMTNYKWKQSGVLDDYLDQVFQITGSPSNIDIDMQYEVTGKDKILTLSTCNRGITEQRFLVQAVLLDE